MQVNNACRRVNWTMQVNCMMRGCTLPPALETVTFACQKVHGSDITIPTSTARQFKHIPGRERLHSSQWSDSFGTTRYQGIHTWFPWHQLASWQRLCPRQRSQSEMLISHFFWPCGRAIVREALQETVKHEWWNLRDSWLAVQASELESNHFAL